MTFQILAGLALGAFHVFSGPDHLAAVAPLSLQRGRGRAWEVGLRWGLGHSSGVLLVGVLAMFLRDLLPLQAISSHAERLVGVVLIGIGLWGIRKALTYHLHIHPHTHDGQDHVHLHVHGAQSAHPQSKPNPHRHTHTAFAVGILHGLAGGSHFLGVLPALAFPNKWQTAAYLLAFACGTIAAMTSFSTILGLLARGCIHTGHQLYRNLMLACSSAAILVGTYWLIG